MSEQCHYLHWKGEHPAVQLVRTTCPRCDYYRIVGVCRDCYIGIKKNLTCKGTWGCPSCGNRVDYDQFWTLIGAA